MKFVTSLVWNSPITWAFCSTQMNMDETDRNVHNSWTMRFDWICEPVCDCFNHICGNKSNSCINKMLTVNGHESDNLNARACWRTSCCSVRIRAKQRGKNKNKTTIIITTRENDNTRRSLVVLVLCQTKIVNNKSFAFCVLHFAFHKCFDLLQSKRVDVC